MTAAVLSPEALAAVCASPVWQREILATLPYGSLGELIARSNSVIAGLHWSDVEDALATHARIGERAAGDSREMVWSRQEQSAAEQRSAQTTSALYEANVSYENRFGHIFLICATGRTAEEILSEVHARLGNDDATEQLVVRDELAAIVRLRLGRLWS
ncbi:MAG TPA: 2-oxo-4-hydroxy-4-carboxy-5-ureidoimidazoline decarboxylase [Jatrophihabitans sp.]